MAVDRIFVSLGASNHTESEREYNDFYATHPSAIDCLLSKEKLSHKVWEPACGKLDLVNRLKELGYEVRASDLIKRVDNPEVEQKDFFLYNERWDGDILTNPPFKVAMNFILHALDLVDNGRKVCMFLKLLFLESQERYEYLFRDNPPKKVYVFSRRIPCIKDGEWSNLKGSAICFAWFVWEKGYKGLPQIDWINTNQGEGEQLKLW